MAVLEPTDLTGRVVFLGLVRARDQSPCATSCDDLSVELAGLEGESHSGLTRSSCSRVIKQYPRGTEIRNARQVSIMSSEELDEIAREMEIDRLAPELLGANIVITGLPDLTLIPPSSRLIFEGNVSLVVDMENAPCNIPAKEIEAQYPAKGKLFKSAARHRRGVIGWVERAGILRMGAEVRLHVPPQRLYPPLANGAG